MARQTGKELVARYQPAPIVPHVVMPEKRLRSGQAFRDCMVEVCYSADRTPRLRGAASLGFRSRSSDNYLSKFVL